MRKCVYISGKITGLPREQYMKLFGIAETMLRNEGYKPVNPTRFWLSRWYKQLTRIVGAENAYRLTLLWDLWRLLRCNLIYKLPGWQQSRGANIESCTAYHMKVWPMPRDVVSKIDKKIEKAIKNYEKAASE